MSQRNFRPRIEPLEPRIAPAFTGPNFSLGSNDPKLSTIQGETGNNRAGTSVSSAGDINGDGFDDIIVGAPRAGADEHGIAYVLFGGPTGFPADISLTNLTPDQGFRIEGKSDSDGVGAAVSGAGDVNGDGIDDVIVGAPGIRGPGNPGGVAGVIFGHRGPFPERISLFDLDGANGFLISGASTGDFLGAAVSSGDVNGDLVSDVIIGAPMTKSGGATTGAVYVLFGAKQRFSPMVSISSLNTLQAGITLFGVHDGDQAGAAVSGAGDVNGDGIGDFVVGAPLASEGGSGLGAAYVVYGSQLFTTLSSSLSQITGTLGFKFSGTDTNGNAGFAVGGAGDMNGDGFADVIVGAVAESSGTLLTRGAAYVIFGKAGTRADLTAAFTAGQGFALFGESTGARFGFAVAGAGDVNGDGLADVLIGAPGPGTTEGAAYLIFGHTGAFPLAQTVAPLGFDGVRIKGDQNGDAAGTSVAAAGDINHDGFADLLIGAPNTDFPATDVGSAYLVRGTPSGNFTTPDSITDGKTATFTDVDGDIVTVKVSKGTLVPNLFGLLQHDPASPRAQFLSLDLSAPAGTAHPVFDGADVTITVKRALGGDGRVDLGFLNAANVDLGAVTISGDLGQINAGDAADDLAVKSLTLGSFGEQGLRTQDQDGSIGSSILGPVGPVKVAGNFRAALFLQSATQNGSTGIASLTIGGSMIGGAVTGSGGIGGLGQIGPVKIGGDLRGGDARFSGVISAQSIASVTIGGSLVGGAEFFSGFINSRTNIGKVMIKHDLIGEGSLSGFISAGGDITSVTVGGDARSGTMILSGGITARGRLGPVTIKGDVLGTEENPFQIAGVGPLTGGTSLAISSIKVSGTLSHAIIQAGFDPLNNEPKNSHAQIGPITVGRDWVASTAIAGVTGGLTAVHGIGTDSFTASGPAGVIASIASITITGRALGTPEVGDRFAIVAEQIGAVTIGGLPLKLTKGPGNDTAAIPIGPTPDFVIREVKRS